MPGAMAKTILVGYDDKEPAKRALERAIAEAKAANADLVVVTRRGRRASARSMTAPPARSPSSSRPSSSR
jgi:nucleotide-binding universal stress UspA family protein